MANATCCAWIHTPKEVDTQLHKVTEQATWPKNATSQGLSWTYLILIGLGLGGPWLQSSLQTLGLVLLHSHNNLPGVLYFLESFKCIFTATHHRANDFPKIETLERQQRKQPI